MAGVDADRAAGGRLLPARAAADRVRAHRRRRQGLTRGRGRAARGGGAAAVVRRAPAPPDWVRRWLERGLGGVVLFAHNSRRPCRSCGALCESLGRGGRRDRRGGRRRHAARAAERRLVPGERRARRRRRRRGDRAASRRRSARELARCGVNLDLAPVADVNIDPRNPVIGVRSFGADPTLVARHVAALVRGPPVRGRRGLREALPGPRRHARGLAPRAADGRGRARDAARAASWRRSAAAVAAGVAAVMTAHILVPAVDDAPGDGQPARARAAARASSASTASWSPTRSRCRALAATVGVEEGAVQALAAGADALCIGARPVRGRARLDSGSDRRGGALGRARPAPRGRGRGESAAAGGTVSAQNRRKWL